ncbi:unnamed protein product [Mesocestoides corti]|uniref:Secreted protein n=1 Tax=Mesocestoides corti TaxID=53468 RepID=A0A0R3URJ8_MESCO|nr:unnamed protein product [Mesocestoides corti]
MRWMLLLLLLLLLLLHRGVLVQLKNRHWRLIVKTLALEESAGLIRQCECKYIASGSAINSTGYNWLLEIKTSTAVVFTHDSVSAAAAAAPRCAGTVEELTLASYRQDISAGGF